MNSLSCDSLIRSFDAGQTPIKEAIKCIAREKVDLQVSELQHRVLKAILGNNSPRFPPAELDRYYFGHVSYWLDHRMTSQEEIERKLKKPLPPLKPALYALFKPYKEIPKVVVSQHHHQSFPNDSVAIDLDQEKTGQQTAYLPVQNERIPLGRETAYISMSQGAKKTMEDRIVVKRLTIQGCTVDILAVLDGHAGQACANLVTQYLTFAIEQSFAERSLLNQSECREALKLLPIILNDYWKKNHPRDRSGTTLCLSLVIHLNNPRLVVVNVGDSRAVLTGFGPEATTLQLSTDASFNNEPAADEKNFAPSVYKRGGQIVLKDQIYRVEGVLSCLRTIGDNFVQGVTARPEIHFLEITEETPKTLVLATDGAWNMVGSNEMAQFDNSQPSQLARAILGKAFQKRTRDNVAVLTYEMPRI